VCVSPARTPSVARINTAIVAVAGIVTVVGGRALLRSGSGCSSMNGTLTWAVGDNRATCCSSAAIRVSAACSFSAAVSVLRPVVAGAAGGSFVSDKARTM
jgi:hypothetical protein